MLIKKRIFLTFSCKACLVTLRDRLLYICDALWDWYHLYNLKNMNSTHGGGLLLVVAGCSLYYSLGVFHVSKIVQMVPNPPKHHMCLT